jgi:hypothetical protein
MDSPNTAPIIARQGSGAAILVFGPAVVQSHSLDMLSDPFPIFVLGMARSGTTLLQRVLNTLDGVTIAGEHFGMLSALSKAYFGMTSEGHFHARTPDEVRALLGDPTRPPGWANYFDDRRLLAEIKRLIESLCRDPERRDRHWGFKEVRYLTADNEVDLLAMLYPDARFIFIVRHPIHVVVSNRVSFETESTPQELAWQWMHRNTNALRACEKYPHRTFFVRYEDLIDAASPRLDELVSWLGFAATPRQRQVVALSDARQSRLELDPRPSEELLSPNELAQVARQTEELRLHFGYDWPFAGRPLAARRADPRLTDEIWELLRTDTTFAPGAEPSSLVRDLVEQAMDLPGWFPVDGCLHFALLLRAQTALGVGGDILEIGSYHGRSSCVLAHHLAAGEKLVLSEIFGSKERWLVDPPSSPNVLRENLSRVVPSLAPERLEIHAGPTASLRLPPEQRFRFIHLYGAQHAAQIGEELQVALAHLGRGGIIAVDPYQHFRYPEVTSTVDGFLAEHPELVVLADLNHHGASGRKLYLFRPSG